MAATLRARNIFMEQMERFSVDIRKILPADDVEADLILTGLRTIIQLNPDMIIDFFYNNFTLPYEIMIISRDESFLTGEMYKKMSSGPFADLHHKINDRWGTLSESEKNIIWDYFKVLVILTKRIYS